MEAAVIAIGLLFAGFLAGTIVGKKYAEIDTIKLVKEYQDRIINGEDMDVYDKSKAIYE